MPERERVRTWEVGEARMPARGRSHRLPELLDHSDAELIGEDVAAEAHQLLV